MSDAPQIRDLVLFLGAGFAWDARLPLMREFGRESISTQRDIERNARTHLAGPTILKAKQTYVAFQALCANSGLLRAEDWLNVEELFGVAETLKQAGVDPIPFDDSPMSVDEVIARIQTWIWKTYQQLPVKRESNRLPVNRKPYETLFSMLKRLDLSRRTTIITTNYDIVAEYFAFLEDIPVHYPVAWDTSMGVTASGSHFVAPPRTRIDGPLLCKLHGSVNYFEWVTGGLLVAADLGDGKETVGNTRPDVFRNEPTIAMYDAIWKVQQDHAGAQPAIVPPSYAKLREKAWLAETWREAANALSNATTVIFVGYSLPRTDGFIRALLVGSQMFKKGDCRPRIVVIDTSDGVRAEYERLYHSIEPSTAIDFATAMSEVIPNVLTEVSLNVRA